MSLRDKNKHRILVVEDDPNTSEVICEALDQGNYIIEKAFNSKEAYEKIESFKPELVLSDHDMPGQTGLEMLKELRQKEIYITVIFVSVRKDLNTIVGALRSGADDYIIKPFRFEEMLARIEVCLRNNEAHRDLLAANEKLKEMVEKDYLTGLFNMRSMYQRIDHELKRAKRFKRKVSCIMLDMDQFKTVNDDSDHLFGSFVLKEIGQIIKRSMREIDFASRYGGDEFLIVLTETDEYGTRILGERIRKNIEEYHFSDGKNDIKLTASLGFAVVEGDQEIDARSLVRRADNNLYKAKNSGKNCVIG